MIVALFVIIATILILTALSMIDSVMRWFFEGKASNHFRRYVKDQF